MTDLIEKKKFYLTPHLVDRIFNIHPEFTWDIHEFVRYSIIIASISQRRETKEYVNCEGKRVEFPRATSAPLRLGVGNGKFACRLLR